MMCGDQTRRDRRLLVGLDRPACNEGEPVAVDRNDAPPGATQAGIDAENSHAVWKDEIGARLSS